MIAPHGGKLINRVLEGAAKAKALETAKAAPKVAVTKEMIQDIQNIANGVFSPIEGFLTEADFKGCIENMRLTTGVPWTIPIVLDVDKKTADGLKEYAAITDDAGKIYALLHVEDKYTFDKDAMAQSVYGTKDDAHPGVAKTRAMKDWLIGGKIDLLDSLDDPYAEFNLPPAGTRKVFEEKGWETVCAFQTRNVPHVGHENLQKTVLGLCDGLLVHPIIGKKKKGDFKDHLILKTYDVLLDSYYNREHAFLNILPTEMRYAGPKEAIHHAIMRKNYGCTHIIIGRDHAGVGNYYAHDAAIKIFRNFDDLDIQPIAIHGDFYYCKKCLGIASDRTCNHPDEYRINFSGTVIRKMIIEHKPPQPEIMRPEVFEVIDKDPNPFVE